MPKSQLDWLGVVSLWLGAAIMAIKAGEIPLMAGAPPWLASPSWGYVPLILITFYLGVAIYRAVKPLFVPVVVSAPAPFVAPNEAKQAHRRQVISDGRRLIAEFNQQARCHTLMEFLQYRNEWPAIRGHLDAKVRRDLENGRLAVSTRGAEKDGKVYYLMDDLARLEKEWDLA